MFRPLMIFIRVHIGLEIRTDVYSFEPSKDLFLVSWLHIKDQREYKCTQHFCSRRLIFLDFFLTNVKATYVLAILFFTDKYKVFFD